MSADLLWVDVDLHDLLAVQPLRSDQPGTHGQNHVVTELFSGNRVVAQPKRAQGQGMVVRDGALALGGGDHRGLEELGEFGQSLSALSGYDSATGPDEWVGRAGQGCCRRFDLFFTGRCWTGRLWF